MNGLAKESAQEMAGYSLHMADSGTDNFDRDFALSLLSSDQDAVYEIEEALKRIEKKTYGICELTGKPIPRARLEAIPWTRFTVDAQAQLEREGALRSRRLGQLGSIDAVGAIADVETEDGEEAEEQKQGKGIIYAARSHHHRMHRGAQGRQVAVALHHHPQQEAADGKAGS